MSPNERPFPADSLLADDPSRPPQCSHKCTMQGGIITALVADPSADLPTIAARLQQPLAHVRDAVRHLDNSTFNAFIRRVHPNNSSRYFEACSSDAQFWNDVLDQKHPPPREFEVHPSVFCPLDCWYCCSPNNYGQLHTFPRDRNVRIVEYLHQLHGHLRTLQISGGREPLFDRDLWSLIQPARALGLHTRLNTSGFTTLAENALHEIATHFDYIAVSLDAPDSDTYQQIKRICHETAFDSIVQAITKATAIVSGRGRIEIAVLVLPENVDRLHAMTRLARDVGADGIRLRRLKTQTLHRATIDLSVGGVPITQRAKRYRLARHLDPKQLLPIFAELQNRWGSARFDVMFNNEDFTLDYDEYVADNRSPCYASNRRLVIDAHGHVFPCPLTAYPDEGIGHGKRDFFGANIMDYPSFTDLWSIVTPGIARVHGSPCATCYVADRYINNFVNKLGQDRRAGVAISDQPFGKCSAQRS